MSDGVLVCRMRRVRMLQDFCWHGIGLAAGRVYSLPLDVARTLVNLGFAEDLYSDTKEHQ